MGTAVSFRKPGPLEERRREFPVKKTVGFNSGVGGGAAFGGHLLMFTIMSHGILLDEFLSGDRKMRPDIFIISCDHMYYESLHPVVI